MHRPISLAPKGCRRTMFGFRSAPPAHVTMRMVVRYTPIPEQRYIDTISVGSLPRHPLCAQAPRQSDTRGHPMNPQPVVPGTRCTIPRRQRCPPTGVALSTGCWLPMERRWAERCRAIRTWIASRPPARRTAQAAVAAARPTVLRRPLAVLCRSPPRPRAPRAWARGVSVRFPSLILPWYKLVSARSRSASRRGRRPVRIEGPRRRRIGDLNIAWPLAYGRRRFRVGARLLSLVSLVGIGTGNWGARDCRRDSCSAQH